MKKQKKYKLLEAAIIGLPNCGKSTLVNSLMNNESICLVSQMAHTTKRITLGSFEYQDTHVILFDTPGLSISTKKPIKTISNMAKNAINNKDICIIMIDASKCKIQTNTIKSIVPDFLKELGESLKIPTIAVINKIDKINKGKLLPIVQELKDIFNEIIPISALTKEGLDNLLNTICLYTKRTTNQEIFTTNLSEKERIIDCTQASINTHLKKELPHNCHIELVDIEINKPNEITLREEIYVSDQHYKIFISQIKKISQTAREKLTPILEKKLITTIDGQKLPKTIKKVHLFIEIKKE